MSRTRTCRRETKAMNEVGEKKVDVDGGRTERRTSSLSAGRGKTTGCRHLLEWARPAIRYLTGVWPATCQRVCRAGKVQG